MRTAFGLIAAAIFAALVISGAAMGQVMVDYDADGFDDRDGSDPDPYDPRVPDRDGDGIRDEYDRYPDDPYNRETTNTSAEDDIGPGGENPATDEDVCCLLSLWWLWVLIGLLLIAADFMGILPLGRRGVLGVIGAAMVVFGLWLGGFLGVA